MRSPHKLSIFIYLCRLGFINAAPGFTQFIVSCVYITGVVYLEEVDPSLVQCGDPLNKVIRDVFNKTISKETIPVENDSLVDKPKPRNYQHSIVNDNDSLKFHKYTYENGDIVNYNYPVPIKAGLAWHVAGPVSPLNVFISLKEKAIANEGASSGPTLNVHNAFNESTVYNNICKNHITDAVCSNSSYYTKELLDSTGLNGKHNGNRINFGRIEPENWKKGGNIYINLAMKEREFREYNIPHASEPAIVGRLRDMVCSDNYIYSDDINRAYITKSVKEMLVLVSNNPNLKAKKS